jgi:spore maturation protein CgeD
MVAASVFLPSYNKRDYVLDAIRSVLAQTCPDWEMWLLENSTDGETREEIRRSGVLDDPRIRYTEIDVDPELREQIYAAARLLNIYYPQASGEYIFYLSDDDIFEPECVQTCVDYLDGHPGESVCYFAMHFVRMRYPGDSNPRHVMTVNADCVRGEQTVDCHIDGAQIVHRKSCLDNLTQPYFRETRDADTRHADGLFMKSLAAHYDFYPVAPFLGVHRFTPVSVWSQ